MGWRKSMSSYSLAKIIEWAKVNQFVLASENQLLHNSFLQKSILPSAFFFQKCILPSALFPALTVVPIIERFEKYFETSLK